MFQRKIIFLSKIRKAWLPASSNHRSISETHCYLQRNQQFHTYSVFPLQKYLCIALPSVCASPRCFIREPVSPALMGQEASAENFDDFFLVICKGSQPSVLADPALFLWPKNFKTVWQISFLDITQAALKRKCSLIICKTPPKVKSTVTKRKKTVLQGIQIGL